jgi:diaminohydroxyphosphoribosylaminopyrimidine deaminase / 5-amino-6-(5-phosphoribosylamino)uracil reductase
MKKRGQKKNNAYFMKMAIRLAARSRGKTFPNPMVGAVIVKNGEVMGKGYHEKSGKPHAEIIALKKAGRRARGAELFVTLEPCCHLKKKTPPCVKSILKSGIRKVHVAMKDPNPFVNGKALKILRDNGIELVLGQCAREAGDLNIIYSEYVKNKKQKCLRA